MQLGQLADNHYTNMLDIQTVPRGKTFIQGKHITTNNKGDMSSKQAVLSNEHFIH